MSIQDISDKFKHFFEDTELFTAFLLIVVAVLAFGLGRMSADSSKVIKDNEVSASSAAIVAEDADTVIASKNGTKYHLPWCAGASHIKEENKITFNTKEEAKAAGYTPAGNCKGI